MEELLGKQTHSKSLLELKPTVLLKPTAVMQSINIKQVVLNKY